MEITLSEGWADQRIAATGQHVTAGETVEVPDELGKSLCEQTDKWTKAKKSEGNDKRSKS